MKIEIVKNRNLTKPRKDFINKNREKHFGKDEIKDFKKDYEPDMIWFFVKDKNQVVALGGLRPIKIKYLGKKYNISGICSVIAIKKKKGYGKVVIQTMIKYLKKKRKTGLGFCGKKNIPFYEKSDLKSKKDLINRFVYINPKTKEKVYDLDGYGIYYEGKDKFISEILSTKSTVYINIPHW